MSLDPRGAAIEDEDLAGPADGNGRKTCGLLRRRHLVRWKPDRRRHSGRGGRAAREEDSSRDARRTHGHRALDAHGSIASSMGILTRSRSYVPGVLQSGGLNCV